MFGEMFTATPVCSLMNLPTRFRWRGDE